MYEFAVSDRAGTYWYHPHPHGRTGPQVYYGMSGMITIASDEEEELGLPSGEHDVAVVAVAPDSTTWPGALLLAMMRSRSSGMGASAAAACFSSSGGA